ncbi:MAG: 2,4-dihydroxyhept-2-ene-1,7-dioic acid aldolase [Alphaproteobacteria bacterium]|nr:2,4-dihydroxyhept-2-ene-1,7-dioic acid aldolase [Alphaproteobacteria bacterium]
MAGPIGLRQRLAGRRALVNGYCMMPGAFSGEVYARQGFDVVTLDLQHGLIEYADAVRMLQALTACDVVPMVRVPWLDPAIIMKVLDAGALGVTCPMIGTAEQADRLVRYVRYPPRGERSLGPIRAGLIHGPGYAAAAAESVSAMAMIETAEGVENVEAIAAVPGLTGIYIGPGDLSLSLGRPARLDAFDPVVDRAVERILAACRARGLIAGIFAPTPARADELVRRGFTFVTLNTDVKALETQARQWVDEYRTLESR